MADDPKFADDAAQREGVDGYHFSHETLEVVRGMLDQADHYLRSVRHLLFQESFRDKARHLDISTDQLATSEGARVIEGVFDGEQMIAKDGRRYPVPPNYASKSKLVAGDVMKLTIAADGTFIYKQIGPVERIKLIGTLEETGGRYAVVTDGKSYQVLTASVTYFKAKPGDQVTIIIPREGDADWAAVENIIEQTD